MNVFCISFNYPKRAEKDRRKKMSGIKQFYLCAVIGQVERNVFWWINWIKLSTHNINHSVLETKLCTYEYEHDGITQSQFHSNETHSSCITKIHAVNIVSMLLNAIADFRSMCSPFDGLSCKVQSAYVYMQIMIFGSTAENAWNMHAICVNKVTMFWTLISVPLGILTTTFR